MANQKGMHQSPEFLLLGLISILHLAPLVMHLLPTLMHSPKMLFSCSVKSFQFAYQKGFRLHSQNFSSHISRRNWNCALVHNLLALSWSPGCFGTRLTCKDEETPPWLPINKPRSEFGENVGESMDADCYSANWLYLQPYVDSAVHLQCLPRV